MDVSALSSNWKQLQQTIKGQSSSCATQRQQQQQQLQQQQTSTLSRKRKASERTSKSPLKLPPPSSPSAAGKKKRKVSSAGPAHASTNSDASHGQKRYRSASGPGYSSQSSIAESKSRNVGAYNSNSKNHKNKAMGALWSQTAEDVQADAGSPDARIQSTAIEDIPRSQRLLVTKTPSSTSLRSASDSINSGLCPDTVAVGKYVALDCEMVGVGPNPSARSMLARVSIVNFHGTQVYDSFVAPKEPVTDYRTAVSGITEQLLRNARSFEAVQAEVSGILAGRILVGHAVRHDLEALMLGHPRRDIRDTSRHAAYREFANGRTPGLKKLAREVLGIEIQGGAHSSIEDARATMMLYRREKNAFEQDHIRRNGPDRTARQNGKGGVERTRPAGNSGEAAAERGARPSIAGRAAAGKADLVGDGSGGEEDEYNDDDEGEDDDEPDGNDDDGTLAFSTATKKTTTKGSAKKKKKKKKKSGK